MFSNSPAGIYQLKVNNKNRIRCEICSKLTIKTAERRYFSPCSSVSVVSFEHVIAGWEKAFKRFENLNN